MRQWIHTAVGLIAGVAGGVLFSDSLLPEEGSPEEQVRVLEVALGRAENRIRELESDPATGRRRSRATFADGARVIAEDIRDGRPVSIDQVFQAAKPLMRDLSPIHERVRKREQEKEIERLLGGYTREYGLNGRQQAALKEWLERKAADEQAAFQRLVNSDSSTAEDILRATSRSRLRDGLDPYLETILTGDALTSYREDRMRERVELVQGEADRKVHRLDSMVTLTDGQRDQVFSIAARQSRHFDPSMQFEGLESDVAPANPGASGEEAILSVLTPDQRRSYDEARELRRLEAEKDLQAIGLTLPPDWNLFEGPDFDD